ncbi:5'-adenylylsulfate reductase-like 3 [Dioscorea cayenensis subsp. rotundata]|uniref:5'-adenylylsulfate reductase-like 3 n=1 Tax=Dioscorea cayennensis subsp. rotundata TaxID=55577 RepID=A0AB40AHE8_DIOCR|nr:5'-adenylylsulfate reductase-like 3 [Dioscorea cayenensis subsp. rotundata]
MASRAWGLGLMLSLAFLGPAWAEEVGLCPSVSVVDSILGRWDFCAVSESPLTGGGFVGVVEGDEVALQMALNLVHKSRKGHVALLFHASWCTFSKLLRPSFDDMSSMFPAIHHFAFDESVIRPSVLSKYGVHGFPTLFLLNSSIWVRYHGPRTMKSLATFYTDVTGIKAAPLQISIGKVDDSANLNQLKAEADQENCPFSWARSPEKLLQQDTYLALAISFVLLRTLYFLLPKLHSCVLHARRRQIRLVSLMNTWEYFHACLSQAKQSLNRLNPCKRSDFHEGAMHAKIWASKSLASVSSIGESSTGRSQCACERR